VRLGFPRGIGRRCCRCVADRRRHVGQPVGHKCRGSATSSHRIGQKFAAPTTGLQRTAAIGRRPLEGTHYLKPSVTLLRRRSAADDGRTSPARSAELGLPTRRRYRGPAKADRKTPRMRTLRGETRNISPTARWRGTGNDASSLLRSASGCAGSRRRGNSTKPRCPRPRTRPAFRQWHRDRLASRRDRDR